MMLKINYRVLSLFIVFVVFSCTKNETNFEELREKRLLESYLTENHITETPTSSGLYILNQEPGEGLSPDEGDFIRYHYTGRLIGGKVFATTDESFAIDKEIWSEKNLYGISKVQTSKMIPGLIEGTGLMKEGGKATFIIPSSLAYGGNSQGGIPVYSTLIFDIELTTVIKDPVAYEKQEILDYLDAQGITAPPYDEGLYVITQVPGEGDEPEEGSKIKYYYSSRLLDGRLIDENLKAEDSTPSEITIGVSTPVKGLEEGLKRLLKGSKAMIIMDSGYAYGEDGYQKVPPYSPLVYEVEVEDVITSETGK